MLGRVRPGASRPGRARSQRGAVTAETAMMLPVLVAVTIGLVWALSLAAAQMRTVDAARETARAVARDEPTEVALALGRRVAPAGAKITVTGDGDAVEVWVESPVKGPGGLFDFLPSITLTARAVARAEGWDE